MMERFLTCSILMLLFAFSQFSNIDKPDGLFPILESGKWGYINSEGQTIVKCQFIEAREFSEGLAAVVIDSAWGFIDTTGKMVIKPKYYSVSHFSDGLCNVIVREDTAFQNTFIRKDGSIAFITELCNVSTFSNGRAKVKINDEICYLNKKGEVEINTHLPYSSAGYSDEIAVVWSDNSSKFIDTTGNTIRFFNELNSRSFSEGLAIVRENGIDFYIDKQGNSKIIPDRQDLAYGNFSDGLAQATIPGLGHKSGFIDMSGLLVIPIQYDEINNFHEGLAAFRDKNVWGFIDKTGQVVVKPQFDHVEYNGFSNGLCRVELNSQWGYINRKGEFVWKSKL